MSKQPSAQGPADVLRVMSYVILGGGIAAMSFLIANGRILLGLAALLIGIFFFALGLTVATMAESATAKPQQQKRPKLKL